MARVSVGRPCPDGASNPPVSLPRTDSLVTCPDDACSWAWADGFLHPAPPPPVARVSFIEAGSFLPTPFYPPIEGRPCGAVFDVPPEATADGQRRRFTCDRPAGHQVFAPPPGSAWAAPAKLDHDGEHRAVVGTEEDQTYGLTTCWPVDHAWSSEGAPWPPAGAPDPS